MSAVEKHIIATISATRLGDAKAPAA
jgi:hypothetical protein